MGIDSDLDRFKNIIKNKVKNNFSKYISSDHIIGQQGGEIVKIPIDRLDLPRFTYASPGGASSGEGEPGDPLSSTPGKSGEAGNEKGEHSYSAEFTPEELAQLLGEHLQLPDIQPKGKGKILSEKGKYTDIANEGPEGLRHFKRTYKETLKRAISSGEYDPDDPKFIPIKNDKRYKSVEYKSVPEVNTVIIYIRDISGSITEEMRYIIKSEIFWVDLWLKHQYKNIESRFIVHEMEAKEVNREEFFTISEGGGTLISSAYELVQKMMEEYPFSSWNVYLLQMTDGDNFSSDNDHALSLLKEKVIKNCNLFSYVQVLSECGFIKHLLNNFAGSDNISLSHVSNREGILGSIKAIFGKGL